MDIRNREAVLPYVEQFLEGDLEAFSFIYKIYKNSVYYFAVSITKNTADAEEVVQETFLKVYHKVHQLEDLSKFHSWIFSITYNTALNMNRRKSYTLVSYEDTVAMGEEDKQLEGASEDYDKKELVEIIGERFTQLPPDLFAVAKLRYSAKTGSDSQNGESILTTTEEVQQAMESSSLTSQNGGTFGSEGIEGYKTTSNVDYTEANKSGKIKYVFNSEADIITLTLQVGIDKKFYDYSDTKQEFSDALGTTSVGTSTGQLFNDMKVT